MTIRIENAFVESTMLGREDHGIMTAFVFCKGEGWGCGFGGFGLDTYDKSKDRRVGVAFGIEFISRILETLEVSEWEKLKGTPLRVETEGWGGGITKIGHYVKDKWFDPKALAEKMVTE